MSALLKRVTKTNRQNRKIGDVMKIAICEDELLFQQKLKLGIERFFTEKKIETTFDCFMNGDELIHNLKNEYDVIFLDIQLGTKTDGMDIAEQLRNANISSPVICGASPFSLFFEAIVPPVAIISIFFILNLYPSFRT